MSATIKVIYRGEDLSQPDQRDMFIEVDDSIHLHYRDLRLDFSRKEFEDFVGTFKKQADSLLQIIDKTDCKDKPGEVFDGQEFKIWSNSQLKTNAAVNPQRVSLEECSDGYRLHYRNYGLLLDEKGFQSLKKAFAAAETNPPAAQSLEELTALFKQNRIKFRLTEKNKAQGGGKPVYQLIASEQGLSKVRAIMAGIGMEGRLMVDRVVYAKNDLSVELVSEEDLAAAAPAAVQA